MGTQACPGPHEAAHHLVWKSPGDEFTWEAPATQEIRAGDLFYIEVPSTNSLRASICGVSGPFNESTDAPRIKYFRDLSAGKHRQTSFRTDVRDLPDVTIVLSGPSGSIRRQTDADGGAEWKALQPGRYTISVSKRDYSLVDPEEALKPVDLRAGACSNRFLAMQSRFGITGIVRLPDGQAAPGLNLRIEHLFESPDAHTISDEHGGFTFSNVDPGEYTLIAGDSRDYRSPVPTTYYPGVPNRELSMRISVGPNEPERELHFSVPPPPPTRTIVLKIESPVAGIHPKVIAQSGVFYNQVWSAADSTITAAVSTSQPIRFIVQAFHLPSIKRLTSQELTISPGTAPLELNIQLLASPPVSK